MEFRQHLAVFFFSVVFAYAVKGVESGSLIDTGKINITVSAQGLFSFREVRFSSSFSGSGSVKVFTSLAHAVQSGKPRGGAATWVESVSSSGFTACVLEFGRGSNGSAQVNWLAFQSAPEGVQHGSVSYDLWTTGTKCKRVSFAQRFRGVPKVFSTPRHNVLQRPQDAMLVWLEDLAEDHFNLCLREARNFDGPHENIEVDWFAYTAPPKNVTHTDSLVFSNLGSPTKEDNFALCMTVNFTGTHFYAPPVVLASAKHRQDRSNANSLSPDCNAITTWVEYTSTRKATICFKDFSGKGNVQDTVTIDYTVVGDLDPCINVTCEHFASCKAFGPFDARCVCRDSCPSYEEPVCSSNGTTFDNECLFEKETCDLKLNFTMQHPGSCEGFPLQNGRTTVHLASRAACTLLRFRPYVFYPDRAIHVQLTINHHDSTDKKLVHDAAVPWVENVNPDSFKLCMAHAGHNERGVLSNASADWLAYQGAPNGGVAGKVLMSNWWTGTKCETVNLPAGKFPVEPVVFATPEHHNPGLERDAASVWVEDVTTSSFKVCLRELQNFDGPHRDIYVNWLVFLQLHRPLFTEHGSVYFANGSPPSEENNGAYCQDVVFSRSYQNKTPEVFVAANHSTGGGNLDAVHNGITAWLEYINNVGFRMCLKELYETKFDPLSVTYTVLSDICESGWSFYGGYCYFTSSNCTDWLSAENTCSDAGAHLATVHNQEENVYIQHRHNGEKAWIGLNDRSVEGTYVYSSHQKTNFTFWAKGQPNNFKDEDCSHTLGVSYGYRWNDVPCGMCENYTCMKDLDECATGIHSCHRDAICSNTDGSYSCACKHSFVGDGRICSAAHDVSFSTKGYRGRYGPVQQYTVQRSGRYRIRAAGARGGTHVYSYGSNPGTYYGGRGAVMSGTFQLTKGTVLKIVVGQRGGNSVEVRGGRSTTRTAASLGLSIEDNAGTGGGGGSFVYKADNTLLIAAGGGGGASGGYNGVDGQSGTSGASSVGANPSQSRGGGSSGQPGVCNSGAASYHGGVGAGWLGQGCARQGISHGERGGSRDQGWVGGQAGSMNSGNNGGPPPGAVGGFGGGGGGSEDNGASGGGGGYSGGGSGTHWRQAGGGGGSYCASFGSGCSGSTGGNSADDGFVRITKQ